VVGGWNNKKMAAIPEKNPICDENEIEINKQNFLNWVRNGRKLFTQKNK